MSELNQVDLRGEWVRLVRRERRRKKRLCERRFGHSALAEAGTADRLLHFARMWNEQRLIGLTARRYHP
ncbi:MAG: hypothetical protein LBF93_03390 [Zoogloeaceae bacterium]|nr:hypothetical protein [Zoogloeaceae bacterium]